MKLGGVFSGRRHAAIGKAFYVKELRGQLIACKWPRRRLGKLHPTTVEQNEKFKQANKLVQFVPARIQMAHRKMVEGTNLLPRDLMISAMYGRGLTFILQDQVRRYPVAARQDLSDTLDILGGVAGDILGRGPELWTRVRPSTPGQALISNLAGELPTWQTIGSQDGLWTQVEDYTFPADLAVWATKETVIAANWKSIDYTAMLKFDAAGQEPLFRFDSDAGANYNGSMIYQLTGGAPGGMGYSGASLMRIIRGVDAPMTGNYLIHLKATKSPWTNNQAFQFQMSNTNGNQSSGGCSWMGGGGSAITSLKITSGSGVGIRKDSRIIVRVAYP